MVSTSEIHAQSDLARIAESAEMSAQLLSVTARPTSADQDVRSVLANLNRILATMVAPASMIRKHRGTLVNVWRDTRAKTVVLTCLKIPACHRPVLHLQHVLRIVASTAVFAHLTQTIHLASPPRVFLRPRHVKMAANVSPHPTPHSSAFAWTATKDLNVRTQLEIPVFQGHAHHLLHV